MVYATTLERLISGHGVSLFQGMMIEMRQKLTGREYKLLLDPEKFQNPASTEVADRFWNDRLKPVIDKCLGPRNGGRPRWEANFSVEKRRTVSFWDTQECDLTGCDLALRERRRSGAGYSEKSLTEITLKLRLPDMFVVGSTSLPGSRGKTKTSFEEDIAPLEVGNPLQDAPPVVVPVKRSIRSRFSLSTTQRVNWRSSNRNASGLKRLFPSLEKIVPGLNKRLGSEGTLVSGPVIDEFVFCGARVRFGKKVVGNFALTLWYFGSGSAPPAVAEISFKCAPIGKTMPGGAARRALDLFLGMQTRLGDWVNFKDASKTILALPNECRNGQ